MTGATIVTSPTVPKGNRGRLRSPRPAAVPRCRQRPRYTVYLIERATTALYCRHGPNSQAYSFEPHARDAATLLRMSRVEG